MGSYQASWLEFKTPSVRSAWAALVERSPHRTPFAALEFGEALAGALATSHGIQLRTAGVHDGNGVLVGGVLLYERQRGPYRLAVVPPLGLYTPIVLADPLRESDVHERRSPLDALIPFLDAAYHAHALHLHPAMADVRSFLWSGYETRPRYTYWQPLAEPETMLRAGSRSVRRRLRDYDAGSVFAIANDQPAWERALDALGTHLHTLFDSKEADFPLDADQRAKLLSPLRTTGLIQVATLQLEASAPTHSSYPEAVSVILNDGAVAHKWFSASVPGPAMTLLNHSLRTKLFETGVSVLDYTGANIPRVAEFKRSFGATLTPYFRVERYKRPELRALALVRPFL